MSRFPLRRPMPAPWRRGPAALVDSRRTRCRSWGRRRRTVHHCYWGQLARNIAFRTTVRKVAALGMHRVAYGVWVDDAHRSVYLLATNELHYQGGVSHV